ncbi:MAG: hypothetical protein GF411_19300 [Candidatus Lokiarchaeota archaeon]|nr:hypothetical protein [Candidatus Lokiarchaeota archaeon]
MQDRIKEMYFQFLIGLKEHVIADNDQIPNLADVLSFLHTIGPRLEMELQEKALTDIAEIMQISVRMGRLDIAGLIGVVGSAIVKQEEVYSVQYVNQVFNLFMNCLNIAKPILREYEQNPNLNLNILRKKEPERHFAWDVLDDIWRAMYAILVHSEKTRVVLKDNQKLRDFLGLYVGYHEGLKSVTENLDICGHDTIGVYMG